MLAITTIFYFTKLLKKKPCNYWGDKAPLIQRKHHRGKGSFVILQLKDSEAFSKSTSHQNTTPWGLVRSQEGRPVGLFTDKDNKNTATGLSKPGLNSFLPQTCTITPLCWESPSKVQTLVHRLAFLDSVPTLDTSSIWLSENIWGGSLTSDLSFHKPPQHFLNLGSWGRVCELLEMYRKSTDNNVRFLRSP